MFTEDCKNPTAPTKCDQEFHQAWHTRVKENEAKECDATYRDDEQYPVYETMWTYFTKPSGGHICHAVSKWKGSPVYIMR